HDAVDGPKTVFPVDFLAFLIGAAVVGDAHFVDAQAGHAGYFGGDFGLEAEAVFLQGDTLDDIGSGEPFTRFHVGQVQVVEHVRQEGQKLVPDRVPEKEDAVRLSAHEARAVHDVGHAFVNGLEQQVVFLGVVFEIGVLDDDVFAGGFGDAGV